MRVVTFKAPEDLVAKLEQASGKLERSKGDLIRRAIRSFLTELEEDARDTRIALRRLAKDNPKKRIPLEALERKYGLED